MKTFDDLEFTAHPMSNQYSSLIEMSNMLSGFSGGGTFNTQARLFFDNGYGVSVVTGPAAYDNYEVAILKGDEEDSHICYDTEITDDVIACNGEDEVTEVMKQVQQLV